MSIKNYLFVIGFTLFSSSGFPQNVQYHHEEEQPLKNQMLFDEGSGSSFIGGNEKDYGNSNKKSSVEDSTNRLGISTSTPPKNQNKGPDISKDHNFKRKNQKDSDLDRRKGLNN